MVRFTSGSLGRLVPRIAVLMAMVATLAVIAGCGSSSSSSSSSGAAETSGSAGESGSETSSGGEAGSGGSLAKAEELVAEFSKSDQTIGVEGPLKTRPKDATFAFLPAAGESSEKYEAEGWNAAAKVLGVKSDTIPQGATPTSLTSAWNQAVDHTPAYSGLFYGGTPPSTVSGQISSLVSKEVPIVGFNSNLENKPGGGTTYPGVDFDIAPNPWAEEIGQIQAAWIATESNAEAKVLYVNIKAFPGLVLSEEAFDTELENLCSKCSVSSLPVEVGDIGTHVPEKVLATLQSDPSINYVVFGFGDVALGVPQALKSANLSESVQLVTQTGGPQNIEYIENGEQAMDVSLNLEEAGWKAMDVLARLANGESTEPANHLIPLVIVTTESLKNGDVKLAPSGQVLTAPNFEQEYTELWTK
jgi:ribose transport system substrate-binding protein